MAITGHKTMAMFNRYNSVSPEEMKAAIEAKEEPNVTRIVTHEQIQGI